MDNQKDQEFVEYVVKAIVDNPDDVTTERDVDEMGVLITLHLNPKDMGYVIGSSGQNARALRTLLRIVGARNNSSEAKQFSTSEVQAVSGSARESGNPGIWKS